jgi:ADP-ribosyl-[dinitrogen reductase] hydrolase
LTLRIRWIAIVAGGRRDISVTGAIYGQLAGTFYGVNAIPEEWIARLARREFIAEKADALFDLSTE